MEKDVINFCRICQCGADTLAQPTPISSPSTTKKCLSFDSLSEPVCVVQIEPLPNSEYQPKQNCPPESPDYTLISPCLCSGSLKYVHQHCLRKWVIISDITACELCHHPFEFRRKFKPLWKWESLPNKNHGENKRIICSGLMYIFLCMFLIFAACVLWSHQQNQTKNHPDWQQTVTLIVVFVIAAILMCVWGMIYLSVLIKWVIFNRTFEIINKK